MRLYLAGPMRGLPRHNFDAFDAAAALLRKHGHTVLNPADRDREVGFDPDRTIEAQGFSVEDALRYDITYIVTEAEGIALLPGWERSIGARLERRVAEAIGLPVFLVHQDARDGLVVAGGWDGFSPSPGGLDPLTGTIIVDQHELLS